MVALSGVHIPGRESDGNQNGLATGWYVAANFARQTTSRISRTGWIASSSEAEVSREASSNRCSHTFFVFISNALAPDEWGHLLPVIDRRSHFIQRIYTS